MYRALGGLRQDPARAAESSAEARIYGHGSRDLRALLSAYGWRGGVAPTVGLALRLRALGTRVRVCAPLDREAEGGGALAATGVDMTEHAVVIAGGPTGLMLAGELPWAGVDVAIVERLAAGGLHSPTIEVLDQRCRADRFFAQEKVAQVAGYALVPLDVSDFPTRHNYGLALWQNHIERILAGWIGELVGADLSRT